MASKFFLKKHFNNRTFFCRTGNWKQVRSQKVVVMLPS